ncbi:MAG: hypothetical protein IT364_27345 [Candidatus Hydrogenedentes bacterium]|nr:hypothetical protein [Candidatus Hydrogenedentota bacterium]
MLAQLQESLFAAGALTLLAVVVLFFMYFFRREHFGRFRTYQQSRDDLANMMILLHTMRDILDQQKQLARQLNASLDKKVKLIKETVAATVHELEEVRSSVQKLAEKRNQMESEASRAAQDAVRGHRGAHLRVLERDAGDDVRASQPVFAVPEELPDHDDILDTWVGLDFGGDEPDPLGFEVPEAPPEEPADAEAARDAFRALLNMSEETKAPHSNSSGSSTAGNGRSGGNGKTPFPLHTQVYEYNDAGMSVSQIAQELGIGKGEVRLILSLRKDRSI